MVHMGTRPLHMGLVRGRAKLSMALSMVLAASMLPSCLHAFAFAPLQSLSLQSSRISINQGDLSSNAYSHFSHILPGSSLFSSTQVAAQGERQRIMVGRRQRIGRDSLSLMMAATAPKEGKGKEISKEKELLKPVTSPFPLWDENFLHTFGLINPDQAKVADLPLLAQVSCSTHSIMPDPLCQLGLCAMLDAIDVLLNMSSAVWSDELCRRQVA